MTTRLFHRFRPGDLCPCYCGGKLKPKEMQSGAPHAKANDLVCSKCGHEPPEGQRT